MREFLRHLRHPRQWWAFRHILKYWDAYDQGLKYGYREGYEAAMNERFPVPRELSLNGNPLLYDQARDLEGSDEDLAVSEPGGL
jgi:hypothetical protein